MSTGDSLIWSKHHGIVQWPTGNGIYYRIAGIQNRNTGDKPPGVKDFFDFQPGDMFEYVSEHHETFQKYDYHRTKITINSRTDSGSSITYTYSGAHTAMNYDYLNNPPGNATSYLFTPVSGSFTITDSANHAANGYHHQMVSLNAAFMNTVHMLDGNSVLFTNEVWYETRHFIDSLGNYGVVIGGNDPVDSSTYTFWGTMGAKNLSSGSDTTYMVYDGINMYPSFTHTGSAYVAGLGMVRASFRTVGYPDGFIYSEKLVAYRKGNDTVGVFTPDAILLGLSTDEVLPGLVIYPNPASDYLHIETKGAFVNLVCVYDATGRLVLRHANDGLQCVVNAQTLNEGIYYVEVFTEKGKIREKLFVHR
ncbi:MAG: T9SS type A sorting domain-containing protein [Bacteroidetes bacterium]|nr:T9SS type A sorting domain-containing protein [Bacteroidota bacterium]